MQIKYELESKEKKPLDMLKYLLPLLLYDRFALYNFDGDDPECHTPTTAFQYYFLSVRHKSKTTQGKLAIDLLDFCSEIQAIEKNQNKVYIDKELSRLLRKPYIQKLYNLIIEVAVYFFTLLLASC